MSFIEYISMLILMLGPIVVLAATLSYVWRRQARRARNDTLR